MAWNQPGGAGDKDPWGKRKVPEPGFDLERALRTLRNRMRRFFGIRGDDSIGGGGFGVALVLVVLVVAWVMSGFYIVQQGERGVVIQFGQKTSVKDAGLHWRWPYPIQRVEKVNVEKPFSLSIGFRINARSGAKSKVPKEALVLTQDESVVDVEFSVQYKVDDVEAYLFNVKDPETTIAQAAESALREALAKHTLDIALTEDGRSEVARTAQVLLQKTLDRYAMGVASVTVDKPLVQPPEEVRAAFDEVAKVVKEAQGLKSEAEAYAGEILPRARATVARQIQEAEAYKATIVTHADGDARRFALIANEYIKAPAITRERLYIEMMEQVLTSTTKVFVDTKAGSVINLPIDKLMPTPDNAIAPPPAAETETPAPAKAAPNPRARGDQRTRKVSP